MNVLIKGLFELIELKNNFDQSIILNFFIEKKEYFYFGKQTFSKRNLLNYNFISKFYRNDIPKVRFYENSTKFCNLKR